MANDCTQFSCVFDVGSAEKAQEAEEILGEFASDLACNEEEPPGFQLERLMKAGPGVLWIHSDKNGSPENAVRFVKLCAKVLDLHGVWGFGWNHPDPPTDISDGGACVLDLSQREVIGDVDYNSSVYDRQRATGARALRTFLNVSNSHLSLATQRWLDSHFQDDELRVPREDAAALVAGGKTRYGWLVYAPEDPVDDLPADLAAILRRARRQGAEYALFDRDAPVHAGLPILDAE